MGYLLQIQTSKMLCSVINQADYKQKKDTLDCVSEGLECCTDTARQQEGKWEMRDCEISNSVLSYGSTYCCQQVVWPVAKLM